MAKELKSLKIAGEEFEIAPKALQFFELENEEDFYTSLDHKTIKDGIHNFYVMAVQKTSTEEENLCATKVINNTLYKVVADLTNGNLTLKIKEIGQEETSVLIKANSGINTSGAFTEAANRRGSGFVSSSFKIFEGNSSEIIRIIYEQSSTSTSGAAKDIFVFTFNKSTQSVTEQQIAAASSFSSFLGPGGTSKYYHGVNDIYMLKAYKYNNNSNQFLYAIKRNEVLIAPSGYANDGENSVTVNVGYGKQTTLYGNDKPFAILKFEEAGIVYDVLNVNNKAVLISPTGMRETPKHTIFLGGKTFIDPRTTVKKTYTYSYATDTFSEVETLGTLTTQYNGATAVFNEEENKIYMVGYTSPSTTSIFILDGNGNVLNQQTLNKKLGGGFVTKKVFLSSVNMFKFKDNITAGSTDLVEQLSEFDPIISNALSVGSAFSVNKFKGKTGNEYIYLGGYVLSGQSHVGHILLADQQGNISYYKNIKPKVADTRFKYGSSSSPAGMDSLTMADQLGFGGEEIFGYEQKPETFDIGENYFIFRHKHSLYYENFEEVFTGDFGLLREDEIAGYFRGGSETYSQSFSNYVNNDLGAIFENKIYGIDFLRKLYLADLNEPKGVIKVKSSIVFGKKQIIDL